jgi:ribonucleoside-diphosphate reductase alpha chain
VASEASASLPAGAGAGVAKLDAAMSLAYVDPASDMKFCAIDDPDCEACQ